MGVRTSPMRLLAIVPLSAGALTVGLLAAPNLPMAGATTLTQTVYDSTTPGVDSVPSWGFEATQTSQVGNEITFAPGTSRVLDNVSITMESWACQYGAWQAGTCTTSPGSTYTMPLTVNLYNVGPLSGTGQPTAGSLITSVTQNVTLAYRPSADTTGAGGCTDEQWFDGTTCHYGLADPVTVNLGDVTVPDSIVYGIAYNTSDYGSSPYGDSTTCDLDTVTGCAYDATNVGLAVDGTGSPVPVTATPSVGSNPLGASYGLFFDSADGWPYCDDGASGVGTFRFDSGCTSSTEDDNFAVRFNAEAPNTATFTSAPSVTAVSGKGLTYVVTTGDGSTSATPTLTTSGAPAGYKLIIGTGGSTGAPGTAKLVGSGAGDAGNYTFTIDATNGVGAATVQTFTLHVLAFSSAASTSFTVGTASSFTIAAVGGTAGQTLTTGAVPAKLSGLSFHDNGDGTATLSGTPAAHDSTGTIKVKFTSGGMHVVQAITVTIVH